MQPQKIKVKLFEENTINLKDSMICTGKGVLSVYNKDGELVLFIKRELLLTEDEAQLFAKRAGINEELEIIFDFDPKQLIGTEKEGYYVKFYDDELKKCYCTKDNKVFVVDPSFFV